jgi:hypothetical protein
LIHLWSHSKPKGLLPMTMCRSSVCTRDCGEREFSTGQFGYDKMVNSETFCEETNWKSLRFDISTYQNLRVLRFYIIFRCHLVPCMMTTSHTQICTSFPTLDWLDHPQSLGGLLPMTMCRSSVICVYQRLRGKGIFLPGSSGYDKMVSSETFCEPKRAFWYVTWWVGHHFDPGQREDQDRGRPLSQASHSCSHLEI